MEESKIDQIEMRQSIAEKRLSSWMRLETKSHTAAICRALYAALCRVNRGDLAEKFCSTDTDASSLP